MATKTRGFRLAYALEYLVAMIAIFTSWSEIGGQAALDMMPWGIKLIFSLLLAAVIVGYTSSIVQSDRLWTPGPIRWMLAMVLLLAGMGVVTYFYAMQADAGQSDEGGTISFVEPAASPAWSRTV